MPEDNELLELRRKVAYYEREVPAGKGNCYHKFNEQGICIRCHEDAEEWDAGCVEEIVEDLRAICQPEFVRSLKRLIGVVRSLHPGYTPSYVVLARHYLQKVEKATLEFEMVERWGEPHAYVGSGSVDTDASGATAADVSG